MESTHDLLVRARAGQREALDGLCERFLPRLRRWAHGRLPVGPRDLVDTDDLVQNVLAQASGKIEGLELQHAHSWHSYLRQSLLNALRDQGRRAVRRPVTDEPRSDPEDAGPSPLELALGRERLARYEAALLRLDDEEREAVVARLELGCSYAEVAEAIGKSSPDAARMLVTRACLRLARSLGGA